MTTGGTDSLLLDSLRRRMRVMHGLYEEAVATMDLEHVNAVSHERALPIAFSLFHYVNIEDGSFFLVTAGSADPQPPLWGAGWAERVGLTIEDHGKERTPEDMHAQRIGDLGAFTEYMAAVFARTEAWIATIDEAELDRVVIARPLPERFASTYSARVAGPEGIKVLEGLECWMYQHGLRHMGEIELSRGMVGLRGLTS